MPQEECTAIDKGLRSETPLAFLSKNVIAVFDLDDQPSTTTGMAEDMATVMGSIDIRRFDAVEVKDAEGARCSYSLREAMTGHLQAYYLPWNRNTGYYTILDVNGPAPLFFTAMLSGCGVGFVEASDRSAVRFSHHNINRAGTMSVPDYAALAKSLAFTEASLHPSQYQNEHDTGFAHVHGVMREKRWRFYVQIINRKHNVYKITDVYELKKA